MSVKTFGRQNVNKLVVNDLAEWPKPMSVQWGDVEHVSYFVSRSNWQENKVPYSRASCLHKYKRIENVVCLSK